MRWLETAQGLAVKGIPFVIVTLVKVRGHAPRGAGSKMLVTRDETYGSIGGGNLERTAIDKARECLGRGAARGAPTRAPTLFTVTLNPKGGDWGVQCCGGEVTVLLEPAYSGKPAVAIFGAGHVGWALVQVLQLLPIEVYLIDARAERVTEDRLDGLSDERAATVHLRHAEVPESMIEGLPAGAHLLILTHDHAEDLAILDMALRRKDLGFIGLIGSGVKWRHFQAKLKEAGLTDADLGRVTTPIGLPNVPGKSPAAIAIATAAQLLTHLELDESMMF
jgi:xanthine dehydrogenase accessory factor